MFTSTRNAGRNSFQVDSNNGLATHVGATSMLKDDVYNAAGERLGKIEEIILDTRTGCVRYVVWAVGGFFGIGRKRVAIPWSALTPDLNQRWVLDVALVNMFAVPIFNDDPWLQRSVPTRRLETPLLQN